MLLRWREVVGKVVRVVNRIYPGAEIYLFGGAAENRLTVLSDIDVAVVFHRIPEAPVRFLRGYGRSLRWRVLSPTTR